MVDKCTQLGYNQVTMAEVAVLISSGRVWQLPRRERDHRRRMIPAGQVGSFWVRTENVRDCHPDYGWSADRESAIDAALPAPAQGDFI